MAKFRDLTRYPDPWLLYLLIDPTTEPTSHPQGTVFYVGVAPAKESRSGAKGLRSIDLSSVQMLPSYEKAARERIEALAVRGAQPLVEAITAPWTWDGASGEGRTDDISPEEVERLKGVVVESLWPRPLNARRGGAGVVAQAGRIDRLPGWLLDAAREAQLASIPSDWLTLGVMVDLPVDYVASAHADTLFDALSRIKGTFPKRLAALVEEDGSALLLATASWMMCPKVIPEGFIFGVWEIDAIEAEGDLIVFHRVPDSPEVDALRRALMWKVASVPQNDTTLVFEVSRLR